MDETADTSLAGLAERALARFPDAIRTDPMLAPRLCKVALASDFAIDTLVRQPQVLARLAADDGGGPNPIPILAEAGRDEWPALLRRYRTAESARLVWRDVIGLDDVEATLAETTRLAERCIQLALGAVESDFVRRHGIVRDRDGRVQRLVVFALGKLGGEELNFSSDADLVYAYERNGESDGERPLGAEHYFIRQGQALARLLDEVTADGFSHRIDLRLRPFGNAGRLAMNFEAMAQYYLQHGRDWERYAWQKARPVAGDVAAGWRLLEQLQPFVYRNYLDYGALEGLRGMKAMIAAEVARKDLADDIKRGPGGIREVEFLAQSLQLIHGGREGRLRERRLYPALRALVQSGQLAAGVADRLIEAHRFLRHLENRLQMVRDAQTQKLPVGALEQGRISTAMGYADWAALLQELDGHRAYVASQFTQLLGRSEPLTAVDGSLSGYWLRLPETADVSPLTEAGITEGEAVHAILRDFVRSPAVRELPTHNRARLDRIMPALLPLLANAEKPELAIRRLLALLHNILRRTSYLALLDERPAALERLADLLGRSAFLADRLAAHPLLLDELLDARVKGPIPDRSQMQAACEAVLQREDLEQALFALNEVRQALSFRIALATFDNRQSPQDSTSQLASLADAVVTVVLALASREMRQSHGIIPGARFAVIGYGSLGGQELGFGSDLDLVFIYDGPADGQSEGPRPLDVVRWHTRLTQKVVALLGTMTGAGRLYDVDVRLRPDGASGLLVSSLASYREYQLKRAWTWEHQALVRARPIAGDSSLLADIEQVRREALARKRNPNLLAQEVVAMRTRMRSELDRSQAGKFDLKQGENGLVDLEFLVQYLVLREAGIYPDLLVPRSTSALLHALVVSGVLDSGAAAALEQAHITLVRFGLACTLDRRPRMVAPDAVLDQARRQIRDGLQCAGLVREEKPGTESGFPH